MKKFLKKENKFTILPADKQPGYKLSIPFPIAISEDRAFQLSIEKWELIHKQCRQGILIDDGGVATCALCKLYFHGYSDKCDECPIRKAGHPGCEGTPYHKYVDAYKNCNLSFAEEAARNEIKFLKDLMDE